MLRCLTRVSQIFSKAPYTNISCSWGKITAPGLFGDICFSLEFRRHQLREFLQDVAQATKNHFFPAALLLESRVVGPPLSVY